MKNQSIIVIGSGLAGYLFAKEFRKLDISTPLEIITANDGAFYSKPLLSTALTNKKSADALVINTAENIASQLRVVIHTHSLVEAVDVMAQTITISNKKIAYRKLILACGSYPAPTVLQGSAVSDVHAVNDLTAYRKFRHWIKDKKNIIVIGAGLVGCEFANDLVNGGYHVEVIAREPYPLAKFVPEPIGRALQQALAEKGVQWHLQQVASEVNRCQEHYKICTTSGKTLTTEGVFSAIGIRARCDLAKSINIDCKNGIMVDRYLETQIDNIYALGDCAEVAGEIRQYVAPLMKCAHSLANHFAGDKKPVHYPPMPIVLKTTTCAIVTCPPPQSVKGEWQYTRKGDNQRAVFYDDQEKLQGFALFGDCVRERMLLIKQLPCGFE